MILRIRTADFSPRDAANRNNARNTSEIRQRWSALSSFLRSRGLKPAARKVLLFIPLFCAATAFAEEPAQPLSQRSAREAVREGNERLRQGDAPKALEAYRHAESLKPDALEIPFAKGLSHYALGEFEQARQEFEKVVLSKDQSLANDALYSLGTTYHAEGLQNQADPKQAIGQLENAMQRYQSVLSQQPEHAAARDANLKAALTWRQIKQQLEQQQQQQQGDQQDDQEGQQQEQSENQEPQDKEKQSEEKQEQQASQQKQEESEQQKQQEQESKTGEQADAKQEEKAAQVAEEKEEEATREQAERKLRELVQNLKQRKKVRREEVQRVPIAPVDKDW